jgi:hypothetical protein
MLKNSASDLDQKDRKNHDSLSTAEDDHTEVACVQIGGVRLGLCISRLAQQTQPLAPDHRRHGLLHSLEEQHARHGVEGARPEAPRSTAAEEAEEDARGGASVR